MREMDKPIYGEIEELKNAINGFLERHEKHIDYETLDALRKAAEELDTNIMMAKAYDNEYNREVSG